MNAPAAAPLTPASPDAAMRKTRQKNSEQLARQVAAGDPFARRKLNENSPELQDLVEDWHQRFLETRALNPSSRDRVDYPRFGMLAEIMSRTPVRIYDLPELKARCNTAFVEPTGRMFISDEFFRKLVTEQEAGQHSLFFIFCHEAEHLRRLHLQRMLEYPNELANRAQDVRINLDVALVLAMDDLLENPKYGQSSAARRINQSNPSSIDTALRDFYENLGESAKIGMAMTYEARAKWGDMSEGSIAAQMYKEHQEKPPGEDHEFSFIDLCEAVAQDMDAIAHSARGKKDATTDATATGLAVAVRATGKARGRSKPADIEAIVADLAPLQQSGAMLDRDLYHDGLQNSALNKGAGVPSTSTGDPFIDTLKPSLRSKVLLDTLDMVLNPSQGGDAPDLEGGLRVRDLDLPSSAKNPGQQQGEPGQSSTPAANVNRADEHVISTEELAAILNKAGLGDVADKLGYNDLAKVGQETVAAKDGVASAVNKASEDMMRVGAGYPGGHMVDYAVAQMNDLYRPVLTWKVAVQRVIDEAGRNSRFDFDEPWMVYSAEPADIGVDSIDDIPYQGSFVPGSVQRPLILVEIDTSGSVDDAMLKRFVTEAINMARESDNGESSPEIVILFADTVVRGEPLFINEENYQEFIRNGVNYGGRGGTNFTASIQHAFEMFKEGGVLEGRRLDALVYFTDTFDSPPEQAAIEDAAFDANMNRLPTMLFLAPKECFNEAFRDGVAPYADTIFFDTKQLLEVDLEDAEAGIEQREQRRVRP